MEVAMDKDELRVKAFNSQPAKYRKGQVMANKPKVAKKAPVKPKVKSEE